MSKKISQLNAVVTPVETDVLAVVNDAETKRINIGQLATAPHPSYLVWSDLRVPAHQGLQGPTSKPDYDFTNVGLLFDDSATESIYVLLQMPHDWKEGSNIKPHIHWIQSGSGNVVWELQYKWTNVNTLIAGAFTTLTASTPSYSWTSGNLHQITPFASLSGTGKTISSMLQIVLSRLGGDGGDTYSGDALMFELDFHYQKDSLGSSQEYTK